MKNGLKKALHKRKRRNTKTDYIYPGIKKRKTETNNKEKKHS
jgi:hypothetical protein